MKPFFDINSNMNFDKTAADTVGNVIDQIFTSANKNNIDQSTVVEALKVLPTMIKVQPENIMITGCSMVSNQNEPEKTADEPPYESEEN